MRIFWRFKVIVALGLLLAVALATLSFAKVSFRHGSPTLTYRQSETWAGRVSLLITEQGFPEGRTIFPLSGSGPDVTSKYADPNRLAALADFYSRIAMSDVVLERIPHSRGARGRPLVTASAVTSALGNGATMPILVISGEASTPGGAVKLTDEAASAFRSYLTEKQDAAGIPSDQRVLLTVLNGAEQPYVVAPRKKTIPILVFMAVLAATLGLAMILEHMRPRIRAVDDLRAPLELGGQRSTQQPAKVEVGRADALR